MVRHCKDKKDGRANRWFVATTTFKTLGQVFVTDVTDKGDTGRPTMTGRVSKQERQTSARSATTKRVDGN